MNPNWKILLLGGSGAIGKSTLARQLSKYYNIPLMEVDDIRIALQQAVDKKDHSNLFTFKNDPDFLDHFNIDELVEKLIAVGKELTPAIKAIVEKHIICNEPVIIEGDSILPELMKEINNPEVAAIFLYDDMESLQEREKVRIRVERLEQGLLIKQAQFSFSYGEYIKTQAHTLGLNTIKASPINTLFERVISTKLTR